MGQAIVYCSRCNAQLRGPDFDRGAAVKIEHTIYCRKCLPEGVTPPAPPRSPEGAASKKRGITTVGEIPAVAPSASPPAGPVLLWAGGVATGVGLMVLALVLFSSSSHRGPPPAPAEASPAPRAAVPAAALPASDAPAREALGRLLRHIAEHPSDLDGQQGLLDEALTRAAGTPLFPDVQVERERFAERRARERAREVAELETQVGSSPPDQARILLAAARTRHADPEWIRSLGRLLEALEPQPAAPKSPAAPPKPRPAPAKPAPGTPRRPPELPRGWEEAMLLAAAHEFPQAEAALEQSPDLPLLRKIAALRADALGALVRTPRGERLSLKTREGRGAEGPFVRLAGGLVELKTPEGVVALEEGEIAPLWLVGLARSAHAVDDPTAAAFCLVEGDAAGARSVLGSQTSAVPERFWVFADRLGKSGSEPSRRRYAEALVLLDRPSTASRGVEALESLLRERPGDLFVRRNRAAIATRCQSGRDFPLFAEDLLAAGEFHSTAGGRLENCLSCQHDVEPARQRETYVEAEFSTLPDIAYRAWVLAGGCCQEVFEFSCQGSQMEVGKPPSRESAEPGAAGAALIRPYLPGLKKTHAQHNGPKQASHWEWIAIPLPKYAQPGPQRLRILSSQKGFSVACLTVSAVRTAPPPDAELKELARARAERARATPPPPEATPLYVCVFEKERHLVGEHRDKALYGIPMFNHCFVGVERSEEIVLPALGELRFTYFLKSPSMIKARLRITRNASNLGFDSEIHSPVVGAATEVRLPLSSFKYGFAPGPPASGGEKTGMIHIFSDPDSGLRIDALSIVELKK